MAPRRKAVSPAENIQSDLYALREDVGNLADQVTELLGDKGDEVLDDLRKRVSQMRDSIDGVISEAGARGRAAYSDAKDSADAISETLEDTIRDRPFTMLALAVGLGVVFGATLRR